MTGFLITWRKDTGRRAISRFGRFHSSFRRLQLHSNSALPVLKSFMPKARPLDRAVVYSKMHFAAMGTCQNVHRLYNILLLINFAYCFNLDTEHPRIFMSPEKGSVFGHRVCHFGPKQGDSVIVTDPFYGNGTGGIFTCFYSDGQCKRVPVEVDLVEGSAFGLSLACGNQQAVVCGPHLEQKCEAFNYLNGICVELSDNLKPSHILKPAFQGNFQNMIIIAVDRKIDGFPGISWYLVVAATREFWYWRTEMLQVFLNIPSEHQKGTKH